MKLNEAIGYAKWNLSGHPKADATRVFYRSRNGQWGYGPAELPMERSHKCFTIPEFLAKYEA